jgi:hypothetical protein
VVVVIRIGRGRGTLGRASFVAGHTTRGQVASGHQNSKEEGNGGKSFFVVTRSALIKIGREERHCGKSVSLLILQQGAIRGSSVVEKGGRTGAGTISLPVLSEIALVVIDGHLSIEGTLGS